MRFSAGFGVILTSVLTTVIAQTANFDPILSPASGQTLKAGQNFDIIWQPSGAPDDATITIKLLQGVDSKTLEVGPNVGSNIPNKAGRFTWSVPQTLQKHETYGFIVVLDGKPEIFQYSFPFGIDGLDAGTPAKSHDDGKGDGKKGSGDSYGNDGGYSHDDDDDDDDEDCEDDSKTPHPSASHGIPSAYPTGGYTYPNSTDYYPNPTNYYPTNYHPAPTGTTPSNPVAPPQSPPQDSPNEPHPTPTNVPASDAKLLSWNGFTVIGAVALLSILAI